MEDEDYWNSSTTTGFSFDDEVTPVSSLFDSSGSNSYKTNRNTSLVGNNIFADLNEQSKLKPIEVLLTKHSLNCVLDNKHHKKSALNSTEELAFLRKELAALSEQPPTATTIRSIRLGKPYSLQAYRSLESKTQLLTDAVNSGDGNVILSVVLFLHSSLKKKLFCRLLQSYSPALPVFINYLSTRYEVKAVVELLQMLGQNREAAMRDFQFAIHPNQNIDKRLQRIKCLMRDHFSTPDVEDKCFLDNFMNYVDWQVSSGNRQGPVLGTVITSLMYLCSNFWDEPRGQPMSPHIFTTQLGVSERLFHWTAITAHASSSNWDNIANLVLTKNWLGSKKLNTVVEADRIVTELHRRKAPDTVTMEYFTLIDSNEKQLDLARKLSWHKAAIDTLLAMRDRQGLCQYQTILSPQSNDYVHADSAIKSNVKWKN